MGISPSNPRRYWQSRGVGGPNVAGAPPLQTTEEGSVSRLGCRLNSQLPAIAAAWSLPLRVAKHGLSIHDESGPVLS